MFNLHFGVKSSEVVALTHVRPFIDFFKPMIKKHFHVRIHREKVKLRGARAAAAAAAAAAASSGRKRYHLSCEPHILEWLMARWRRHPNLLPEGAARDAFLASYGALPVKLTDHAIHRMAASSVKSRTIAELAPGGPQFVADAPAAP